MFVFDCVQATEWIFISCAHFDTDLVLVCAVLIGLHYVTEKNDQGYDSFVCLCVAQLYLTLAREKEKETERRRRNQVYESRFEVKQ